MSVFGLLSLLKTGFLELLFPIKCLGCGYEGAFICQKCRASLTFVPPSCIGCRRFIPLEVAAPRSLGPAPSARARLLTGFTPAIARTPPGRTCRFCRGKSSIYVFLSPFLYDNELIRESIHALKYRRVSGLGSVLGGILGEYLRKFNVVLPADSLVIPIPLASARYRRRGFNQAELIGRTFAAELGLGFDSTVLVKIKNTPPQTELSREERVNNLTGTMKVLDKARAARTNVVLLDDVKTTGATFEEAAKVLKAAGARRVWAVSLAH